MTIPDKSKKLKNSKSYMETHTHNLEQKEQGREYYSTLTSRYTQNYSN